MNYEFKGSPYFRIDTSRLDKDLIIELSTGDNANVAHVFNNYAPNGDKEKALADAQLFAAAPELLQACIDVHKKFTEILNLDLSKRGNIKIWDELKTVESAIHKALNITP